MSWSFSVYGQGREDVLGSFQAQAQAHASEGCPAELVTQAAKKASMMFRDDMVKSMACSGDSDGEGGGHVIISVNR